MYWLSLKKLILSEIAATDVPFVLQNIWFHITRFDWYTRRLIYRFPQLDTTQDTPWKETILDRKQWNTSEVSNINMRTQFARKHYRNEQQEEGYSQKNATVRWQDRLEISEGTYICIIYAKSIIQRMVSISKLSNHHVIFADCVTCMINDIFKSEKIP